MADLTAATEARLQKSLAQQYRFSDGIYTVGEWMERHAVRVEAKEVSKIEYNRTKFNRMDHRQQAEYEKKLQEKKTEYRAYMADDTFIAIPKLVYDLYSEKLAWKTYKYIVWNEETDDADEKIFHAPNDERALDLAKVQDDAQLDEMGRPYVYRENTPTSHFGCGYDNCIACNGWVSIADGETVHGERVKK